MSDLTTRSEADRARDTIESALRDHHACAECGQPMGIAEHGSRLWVECGSLRSRRGIRLMLAEAIHERHAIDLPVDELALAA
jgi:ribosomal protein S27AE